MSLRTQPQSVDCEYEWCCPWGWSERRPPLVDPLRLVWFVVKKKKPTRWGDLQSLPVAGWLSVDEILKGHSGKKEKTHCVMELRSPGPEHSWYKFIPKLLLRLLWFFRRAAALFRQFARFRNFFEFAQIWGILESDKLWEIQCWRVAEGKDESW